MEKTVEPEGKPRIVVQTNPEELRRVANELESLAMKQATSRESVLANLTSSIVLLYEPTIK